MTDVADEFDWSRFWVIVYGVLGMVPHGETWRDLIAAEPDLLRVQEKDGRPDIDGDGFLTLAHRGDVVMKVATSSFRRDTNLATARVLVDARWHEVKASLVDPD